MKTSPKVYRSPAVIRSGEVYSLAELRRRLRWKEHAVRQARVAGLPLIAFGREKYALGEDVLEFFRRLAVHLKARGAVVKVVRLPQSEPGSDGKPVKVGLDDFLVACEAKGLNLAGEVRKLLNDSEDPTEPEPGSLKQAASEIDPVPEAAAFLASSEKDGVSRLRFWRGTWL